MAHRFLILSVISSVLLIGCSTTRQEPVTRLTTHIHLDGTKSFEFLSMAPTKKRANSKATNTQDRSPSPNKREHKKNPPSGSQPERQSNRRPDDTALAKKAQQQITERLNTNGYCRKGYISLEEQISRHSIAIKGQCIELASDDDRVLFPNQRSSSVVEEVIDPR